MSWFRVYFRWHFFFPRSFSFCVLSWITLNPFFIFPADSSALSWFVSPVSCYPPFPSVIQSMCSPLCLPVRHVHWWACARVLFLSFQFSFCLWPWICLLTWTEPGFECGVSTVRACGHIGWVCRFCVGVQPLSQNLIQVPNTKTQFHLKKKSTDLIHKDSPLPAVVGTSQMGAFHKAFRDTADCSHHVLNTQEGDITHLRIIIKLLFWLSTHVQTRTRSREHPGADLCCVGYLLAEYMLPSLLAGPMLFWPPGGPMLPSMPITWSGLRSKWLVLL